ncbi:MAG: epoxyqueuosine reductase QueH [Victivallales bacterium]|jgi:predicted adenine nucleotide alpha hydrolase (AANH) superfamily ATPase
MNNDRKILLHVCCAPCATACIETLLAEDLEPILYFSNSNIDSRDEFEKRLSCVEELTNIFRLELKIDDYCHDAWLEHIRGLENEPERSLRCVKCFNWSLGRTAAKAAELEISGFTTTLTVSPHKISEMIFEAGKQYVAFQSWNFKKKDGFRRSLELSHRFGLYRQKYCGCEFSAV